MSPRRQPGERPLPGGYVTPWRLRLLLVALLAAALIPTGLARWIVPATIVGLIATEVYWRRRERTKRGAR
jgi:4-hydroxybenzoate polyprenyltransferase